MSKGRKFRMFTFLFCKSLGRTACDFLEENVNVICSLSFQVIGNTITIIERDVEFIKWSIDCPILLNLFDNCVCYTIDSESGTNPKHSIC